MSEYASAETGEYLRIYPKRYSPIFKPYVHENESFVLNVIQDERAFSFLKKGNFCLFIKSYIGTPKKKKHLTQQTVGCLLNSFPRVAETIKNDNSSLNWTRKYAHVFVLEHHLFLEARSFPRASLLENYSRDR